MTSFHDVRFPADISFKAKGGPEFKTDIVTLSSGQEKRNISWESARHRYILDYKDISSAQAKQINEFFMARRGRAYGFRYKDWNDYTAKNQLIGTGDGTTKQFQLVKNYGEENFSFQRRIRRPVSGNVVLYINSTQQQNNFSVDYSTGIINFNTAPTLHLPITASFEFDVPVRFNTDLLESDVENFSKTSTRKIELIEVKN